MDLLFELFPESMERIFKFISDAKFALDLLELIAKCFMDYLIAYPIRNLIDRILYEAIESQVYKELENIVYEALESIVLILVLYPQILLLIIYIIIFFLIYIIRSIISYIKKLYSTFK
jgi:hypothetical protein